MRPERGARGWPFLIGAGRRHEYRTLIAPGFLVAAAEYGIIDRHARETAEGETRVVQIRSADRPLWMAYVTTTVTEAEVRNPRDEHNRPLQVLTGFVCAAPIERADPADLAAAYDTGMRVYRRYLDEEDRFEVLGSEAYPLRSDLRPAVVPPPAPRRPVRPAPMSRRNLSIVGALAVVVVAVITALAVAMFGGSGDPVCVETTAPAAEEIPVCP
jgi:hypothetical protein